MSMKNEDTLFVCTKCGRTGSVGRCCGNDTREPLNELAKQEVAKEAGKDLIDMDIHFHKSMLLIYHKPDRHPVCVCPHCGEKSEHFDFVGNYAYCPSCGVPSRMDR
jgi:predicted metal-binding protein